MKLKDLWVQVWLGILPVFGGTVVMLLFYLLLDFLRRRNQQNRKISKSKISDASDKISVKDGEGGVVVIAGLDSVLSTSGDGGGDGRGRRGCS